MVDALKGYIGLTSSSAETPAPSGLYVDALPDISVAQLRDIINDENGVNVLWDEIENRAIRKFETFFIREVNKTHRVNDRDKCECLIENNVSLLATALWYLLGEEVIINRIASSRVNVYTSPDRQRIKELRDYYHGQFVDELETAVENINIHASPCFSGCEEQPAERAIITRGIPIM